MASFVVNPLAGTPVVMLDDSGIQLPSFSFIPRAGIGSMDDVETDLVLVTKLFRMDVHSTLHFGTPAAGDAIRDAISGGFSGKKGTSTVLHVPLPNSRGELGRYIMLVGLGHATKYCGGTACDVFKQFFLKAIDLGVESVLVPFTPNAMTKHTLTHKATAFKLKSVLAEVAKERGGLGNLKEVKIFCAPPAVRHIEYAFSRVDVLGQGCRKCEAKDSTKPRLKKPQ